jgi:Galactose oxidase, central domain
MTLTILNSTENGPSGRYSALLQFYNDSLYLWGGESDNEYDTALYRYSIWKSQWEKVPLASSPTDRVFSGSFIHENDFYILPGYSYNSKSFRPDAMKISLKNTAAGFTNINLTSDSVYFPRAYFSTNIINSTVYIFGGKTSDTYLNDLLCANISGTFNYSTLISVGLMPEPRVFHSADIISNNIILFGGQSLDGDM